MALRRTPTRAPTAVRAEMAARDREAGLAYIAADGAAPGEGPCYLLTRADAIDRGETVELSAWELPAEARRGFHPNDRIRLHPDGRVELVRRVLER